jgi:tetratricopeptide (TPR) repeat protein
MGWARAWTGWGPETFLSEFPRFQSVELARAYPDFHHESPHNMFLDAFTECGLPGVLLLAAFCALGGRCAVRGRQNPALASALGVALAAAVVSQQFSVFTVPTALYFFVTLAALVALAGEPGLVKPFRGGKGAAALSALLAGGLILCAIRLVVSDFYLARTERSLDSGQIREAMAAHERARRWQLPGVAAELWYSRALADAAGRSGDLTVRLEAAREALEAARRAPSHTEDRANAFYNLAAFSAAANDFEATVTHLRRAIQAAPHWFKPHWMLARVLALAGRWEEAEAEAARAAELDAGKHPEVSATLDQIRARRRPGPL